MKLSLACLLCVVAVVTSAPPQEFMIPGPNGCRYIMERCFEQCPEGTHSYTTGCNYLTPEATCEEPNPVEDRRGKLCDYSACYCSSPTVRDTKSDKCVKIEDCPKKE